MTSKEKAIEALDTKTYQFLAKDLELGVDFSPKCLSCIKDFINDDDEEDFELMAQKDIDLFDGEEVRYGDYLIKIVPISHPTLDDAIKVVETHRTGLELHRHTDVCAPYAIKRT